MDRIIKIIKNVKSPGPGNINLELIKFGGRNVLALVIKLLHKILLRGNIPQEINYSTFDADNEKGDKRKCENYKGINITDPFIKILGNLLENWL